MKLNEQWAESLTLFFLVIGFVISVLLRTALLSYLTTIIAGFLTGRIFYLKRYKEPILPFIMMILGFLLGYLVGGLWANRVLILIFFGLSFWASYYLHFKGILGFFKIERFVK
ncbi:MAG: hypothetical protein KKA62_02070 [Nanoarchaeota archaeon]|nr:hypothetical protein [Nanoarchaeota archaeon]MBU1644095.1 hypothetical protein [Nanoarchaeota archaeon]MBU1976721.1 hypothetical protein [Nanoarchaeota archaeon]